MGRRKTVAPLTAPQRELASDPRHVRSAQELARVHARMFPGADAAELESVALLGLCVAAQTYDPARAASFTTYLGRVVRWRLLDEFRDRRPKGYRRPGAAVRAPLRVPLPGESGDGVASGDLPVGWEIEMEDESRAMPERPHPPAGERKVAPVGGESGGVRTLDEVVREHVLGTLDRFGGNKKRAAAALGVSLKTIYNHLLRYRDAGFIDNGESP